MLAEMYIEVFKEMIGLELGLKGYWIQLKWGEESVYEEE